MFNTTERYRAFFRKREYLLALFCICSVLLGRAWEAWFMEFPLSTLFWHEELMRPLVELFGSWDSYVQDSHKVFSAFSYGIASLWFVCAVAFFVPLLAPVLRLLFGLSVFFLIFLWFLLWQGKFWNVSELVEHSLQLTFPLLFICAARLGRAAFLSILRWLIAFCFLGHGLYALGLYPTPAPWFAWCYRIFAFSDSQTLVFLFVMGLLDVLAALFLFFPKTQRWALYYCIAWGLLTALARVVANFFPDIWLLSLHQWLFQTVYRLIHGLGPLLLYLMLYKKQKTVEAHSKKEPSS